MDDSTDRPLRSQAIGELVSALAAAKKSFKPVKKETDGQVGTRSYKYADLSSVVDAYQDALTTNGLILTHTLRPQDGHMVLSTTVYHVSEQWLSSEAPVPALDRPQELGSFLTYLKRYNACALLDIVAESDDDGKAAQDRKREPAQETASPSGDVAAILDLAAELQQRNGGTIDSQIKAGSFFVDKDGKDRYFTDPVKASRSTKWLASTRKRMAGELAKLDSASEPGASDSAELFQ